MKVKEFTQDLVEFLFNNPQPVYTSTDYPGDSDRYAF